MKHLRFGILGTAQIARKNWKAILNSGNAVVTAVASRKRNRAQEFIDECQRQTPFATPPKAFGSYEALLSSPDVDAVYIPLPTGLRKQWVIRAAQAGKHVVCEKPCAPSAADLREMIAACREHGVQFMDGVMFMHSRRLARACEVLEDGRSVGAVKRITSAFTFCGDEGFLRGNIRTQSALEPHGCLGDLGWYCIRVILWAVNWQLPREVSGRLLSWAGRDRATGVPTEFSAELIFDRGVSATFYSSFLTENQQWVRIAGTRGHLVIPDFVLPFHGTKLGLEIHKATFEMKGCDFEMRPHVTRQTVAEHGNSHTTAQESNLFRTFADLALSGKTSTHWPDIALWTQQVMDACLESARTQRVVPVE